MSCDISTTSGSVVTCEVTTTFLWLNPFILHQNAVILQKEIPVTCEVTDK